MPVKLNAGISIHWLEYPEKTIFEISNPGTTSVTIYKATTELTHLKSPNVTRFIGNIKRLIKGLTTKVETIRTTPAKRRVYIPFAKTIPETILLTKKSESVSNM